MSSEIFFFIFIPVIAGILLTINLLFAKHSPYAEKNSPFECGFHSFLGQNRKEFAVSFYVFAILFLLFDLEILLVYPYTVSHYNNGVYGLSIIILFLIILTIGFVFEIGKNALSIQSKQTKKLLDNNKSKITTRYIKCIINKSKIKITYVRCIIIMPSNISKRLNYNISRPGSLPLQKTQKRHFSHSSRRAINTINTTAPVVQMIIELREIQFNLLKSKYIAETNLMYVRNNWDCINDVFAYQRHNFHPSLFEQYTNIIKSGHEINRESGVKFGELFFHVNTGIDDMLNNEKIIAYNMLNNTDNLLSVFSKITTFANLYDKVNNAKNNILECITHTKYMSDNFDQTKQAAFNFFELIDLFGSKVEQIKNLGGSVNLADIADVVYHNPNGQIPRLNIDLALDSYHYIKSHFEETKEEHRRTGVELVYNSPASPDWFTSDSDGFDLSLIGFNINTPVSLQNNGEGSLPSSSRDTTPIASPTIDPTPISLPSRETTPVSLPTIETTPVSLSTTETSPVDLPSAEINSVASPSAEINSEPSPSNSSSSNGFKSKILEALGPLNKIFGTKSSSSDTASSKGKSPVVDSEIVQSRKDSYSETNPSTINDNISSSKILKALGFNNNQPSIFRKKPSNLDDFANLSEHLPSYIDPED